MAIGADAFLRLFDPTEIENSQTTRVDGRHAIAHLVGSGHVDKGLHFIVQVLFDSVPMDEPAYDRREAMQERHAPSNTLATANETRFHRSRCCSSCRRPEAVRR